MEEKRLIDFRVVCKDIEEYGQEITKAALLLESRKSEIKQLI